MAGVASDPYEDLEVPEERDALPISPDDGKELYDMCLPPLHTTGTKIKPWQRSPVALLDLPEIPEHRPSFIRSHTDPPGLQLPTLTVAEDTSEGCKTASQAKAEVELEVDEADEAGEVEVGEQEGTELEELPTVTALEIMQSTKPEEAKLEIEEALMALDSYVRGMTSEEHAQQRSSAQFQAALRVGCWTVILSLPIIVWPWALRLQEISSVQREYLGYWGSMLLQFLFCIGPTLGASVKSTLEGWLGTCIATVNMLLLNNAFGPWLSGGAYRTRVEFFDNTTQSLVPTSKWLPLCNNGADLSFNNCFLNMNTALAADAEYMKAIVVLLDFILFVFVMLALGFNTNVRVFSISTHAFYMMSFLDPSTGSFDIVPSLATNYFTIITGASLAVILCFLLPTPITATSKTRSMLMTSGSAIAMVLESLSLTPSELCRSKTQAAMDEVASMMKDLETHLNAMWFEDFGVLKQRAKYRRWVQAYYEILKASIQNIDAVLCAAAALPVKESEQIAATLPSLRGQCFLVAGSLRALLAVKTPDEVKPVIEVLLQKRQDLRQQLTKEFPNSYEGTAGDPKFLLPPALVFCLAVTGVVEDSCEALSSLALYGVEEEKTLCARLCRYLQSLQSHVEIKLYERSITHPRFVLRYTLTLTITFVLGWLGIANVIAPYSSGPASTVSVIIHTFTAASLPLSLRRLNGVLLGKVLGSVAQRLLAIQTIANAILFSLFQLVSVTGLVFAAFHSTKHGGVALLTAAFAMSSLMPSNGIFRDRVAKLTSSDGSFLFVSMVGTFIGVAILLLIDLILASSAKRQAKQRLLRGLGRVSNFAVQVLDPPEDLPGVPGELKADVEEGDDQSEDVLGKLQAGIYEDLDELANLLPYAADEPSLYGRSFPVDLCSDLEKGLRAIARHFRIISWAIRLLEKPQKVVKLKAGSRIFKGVRTPKSIVVLRNELFRPILATLAEEIQKMLENIRILTAARLISSNELMRSKQENQDHREAKKLRKLLQSKLYTKTVSNAFCTVARSPWRMAWKGVQKHGTPLMEAVAPMAAPMNAPIDANEDGPKLRRSNSNPVLEYRSESGSRVFKAQSMLSASKQGAKRLWSQQRVLQKLARNIAKEELQEDTIPVGRIPPLTLPPVTALEQGGAKQGVADNFALRLLLLFDRLREVAANRRSNLPDDDPVATLELIIFFLGSVQTQIQHMQLRLLECS